MGTPQLNHWLIYQALGGRSNAGVILSPFAKALGHWFSPVGDVLQRDREALASLVPNMRPNVMAGVTSIPLV